MQSVLIIIHLIVVAALIVLVLVQRSEGGGLGIGGGGSGLSSTRAQATALGRTTMVLGVLFFVSCIGMAILATYMSRPSSILDGAGGAPATQGGGGLLNQLRGSDAAPPQPAPQPQAPSAPVSGQQTTPAPQAPVAPPVGTQVPQNNDAGSNTQPLTPDAFDTPAPPATTEPVAP